MMRDDGQHDKDKKGMGKKFIIKFNQKKLKSFTSKSTQNQGDRYGWIEEREREREQARVEKNIE